MLDNPQSPTLAPRKIACEIVSFRYADEAAGIMLVGEAEVQVEYDGLDEVAANANLYAVRVDVLTAYDANDSDAYDRVMADETLRRAVEAAALEHYLRPPAVPVGLPRRLVEW